MSEPAIGEAASSETTPTQAVLLERHGAVALITLNMPHKRNALVNEIREGLLLHLEAMQADATCKAVVITGQQHFCAGGALDQLTSNAMQTRQRMRAGHRVVRLVAMGRLPVVAAVQGSAFGAGMSLAAMCDFVVCDTHSRFGAAFGKVGIMPDWGALWMLPQRMGLARTRRFAMFSEVATGDQAVAMGLADTLAAEGQVLPTALALAAQLAQAAPGAISATKAALARFPQGLDAMLDWEADTQAVLIASEDFAEGRAAFFDKRAPSFKGR